MMKAQKFTTPYSFTLRIIALLVMFACTPFSVAEEESGTDSATESSKENTSDETASDAEGDSEGKPKITLTTKDWHDIKRPLKTTDKTQIELLLKEIDERELLTLQAADEDFIGLFLEYNTAQPLGAVLILHDEGLHPDNHQLVAPLRKYLPDYGWNTLAIAIPEPETTPLPDRKWPSYPADFTLNPPDQEETDEAAESSDTGDAKETAETEATEEDASTESSASEESAASEETSDQTDDTASENGDQRTPQEITMLRIEAALQDLINRGQLNIVLIGQGIGASWAVSYLESSGNQEMFTLVMVDPKLPKTEQDKNYINTRISEFGSLPILDIVSQQTSLAKKQAKERVNYARRKQLSAYQQLFMRPVENPWTEHHRIVKRVRGWLAQNAPGEEQAIR
jgi:hypothetical protein